MRKICLSAGIVALGAASTYAQYSPGLSPTEEAKPWTVSATVRGFYDDNYLTLPKWIIGPNGNAIPGARDSFGVEASPSASYRYSVPNTLVTASYVYDVRWYQDQGGTTDQTHQFNAKLDHEFSDRYKMTVGESFVIAQEPTVIDSSVISTPLRVAGNNIHNQANIDFTAQLTKILDLHVGYANSLYAYQQNAGDEAPANSYASYSALLDRIEQTVPVDLRWKALPETTAVLGYQFQREGYTSPEYIILPVPGNPSVIPYVSKSRNSDDNFVYLGVDQSLMSTLSASVRGGIEYLDYYNYHTHSISPYVDASATYTYMPNCTAQFGIRHVHNSTDVAGSVGFGDQPVLDEESTAAYLSVNHRITERFTASLLGQAQYSSFNGGGQLDNEGEDFYIVNLNLSYQITPWVAAQTGYAYNKLNSDIPGRGYTRNQVYIGVSATY